MKTSILILMIAFSSVVFAQVKYTKVSEDFISYHENISAGERMYKNDSLLQAYAKFDIAFEKYKGAINPRHYFKAAVSAIKIKEEFKALDFLEKAIVNGYEIDSARKAELGFFNQNTKKEYFDNIAKWEQTRDAARNSAFELEIIALNESNKKYGTLKYTSAVQSYITCLKTKTCSKTTPDFLSKARMVKEKMKADSATAAQLLKGIQINGFPTMKLVGKKANEIARTILLNYDADKMNERLDGLLSKAMIDGYVSPEFYATLIDRRNVMNGELPEFYEPITGYEKTIGKNLGIANTKRKTIGLYPIKLVSTTAPKSKDPKANKIATGLYDY